MTSAWIDALMLFFSRRSHVLCKVGIQLGLSTFTIPRHQSRLLVLMGWRLAQQTSSSISVRTVSKNLTCALSWNTCHIIFWRPTVSQAGARWVVVSEFTYWTTRSTVTLVHICGNRAKLDRSSKSLSKLASGDRLEKIRACSLKVDHIYSLLPYILGKWLESRLVRGWRRNKNLANNRFNFTQEALSESLTCGINAGEASQIKELESWYLNILFSHTQRKGVTGALGSVDFDNRRIRRDRSRNFKSHASEIRNWIQSRTGQKWVSLPRDLQNSKNTKSS